MLSAPFIVLLVLLSLLVGALLRGAYHWNTSTQRLRERLDQACVRIRSQRVDFRELESLPGPVQRYFRLALKDGQPMVTGVRMRHRGTFNMGETVDRWKPFTSDQKVVAQKPGFVWDGRIVVFPGLPVRVCDVYVAGEGSLHASLLGMLSLVNLHGTDDLAKGELMRFFAEAVWYPTALLPSEGVHWEAKDDHSAYCTLTDGGHRLTMLFTFNKHGFVDAVSAETRPRTVGDQMIPTPWLGRFWSYDERGGMRVPLDGEAAWLLPEGAKPYWRGRITEIVYELARDLENYDRVEDSAW